MKKLLFILLIIGGATASVPALRTRAAPVVTPVFEALEPVVAFFLDPVFGWAARNEARKIARDLQRVDASWEHSLPGTPDEFQAYLRREHTSGDDHRDHWDQPYYLLLTRDSIFVGSMGPDGEQGTADDVRAATARSE